MCSSFIRVLYSQQNTVLVELPGIVEERELAARYVDERKTAYGASIKQEEDPS